MSDDESSQDYETHTFHLLEPGRDTDEDKKLIQSEGNVIIFDNDSHNTYIKLIDEYFNNETHEKELKNFLNGNCNSNCFNYQLKRWLLTKKDRVGVNEFQKLEFILADKDFKIIYSSDSKFSNPSSLIGTWIHNELSIPGISNAIVTIEGYQTQAGYTLRISKKPNIYEKVYIIIVSTNIEESNNRADEARYP